MAIHSRIHLLGLLVPLVACPSANALTSEAGSQRTDSGSRGRQALLTFREREEDASVRLGTAHPEIGVPPVRSEDECRARAASFARAACVELGVDFDTLALDRTTFLPLGLIGTTDKIAYRFRQSHSGKRVEGAISVLLDTRGRLLDLVSTASTERELANQVPLVSTESAIHTALDVFATRIGRAGRLLGPADLLFARDPSQPFEPHRLVWSQIVEAVETKPVPAILEVRVDARTGATAGVVDRVLRFEVTGTVGGWITPGILPDALTHPAIPQTQCSPCGVGVCSVCPPNACAIPASNGILGAAVPTIFSDIEIVDDQGNSTWSDAHGVFRLPGSAPRTVTARFRGRHVVVSNAGGPDYALTTTLLHDDGNRILLGGPAPYVPDALLTAQANAYWWITEVRRWIGEVNPADTTFESDGLRKFARVNLPDSVSGCDARFMPRSMLPGGTSPEMWFTVGGGICGLFPIQTAGCGCCGMLNGLCTNKANATVIVHELGHWMNQLDFGIESPSAFNEGIADVWATYVTGRPELFPFFCTEGTCIRSGENCRSFSTYADQFLGDPHKKGEPILGAMWKVRKLLSSSHGATAGASVANALFRAWCSTYPEFAIHPGIKRRWVVLDDDDANPLTPSPHQAQISSAFETHGL